jgi:hypothetical protein
LEKITHTVHELVAQRDFGIACGYPDANNADRLADDAIQKVLLDRDPIDGLTLASQPTSSRFENGASRRELYQLGRELAVCVVDRHQRRPHGRARRHCDRGADPAPAAGSALRRNSNIRWPWLTTPSISALRSGGTLSAGEPRMSPPANPQQTPQVVPFPESGSRPKLKLLDRVRHVIRARHYSRRTEEAYVHWIRR